MFSSGVFLLRMKLSNFLFGSVLYFEFLFFYAGCIESYFVIEKFKSCVKSDFFNSFNHAVIYMDNLLFIRPNVH